MVLTHDVVMAGNAAAVKQLVRERASSYGKEVLRRVWGVRKAGGALELPAQAAADNPLLAVMWARFQESCRLFYASGGLPWLAQSDQLCASSSSPPDCKSPSPSGLIRSLTHLLLARLSKSSFQQHHAELTHALLRCEITSCTTR